MSSQFSFIKMKAIEVDLYTDSHLPPSKIMIQGKEAQLVNPLVCLGSEVILLNKLSKYRIRYLPPYGVKTLTPKAYDETCFAAFQAKSLLASPASTVSKRMTTAHLLLYHHACSPTAVASVARSCPVYVVDPIYQSSLDRRMNNFR